MQMEKEEKRDTVEKTQTAVLWGREKASLSQVEAVLRFDESGIVCETKNGTLVVEGQDLHMTVFSAETGMLTLCGEISGFFYEEKKKKAKTPWHGGGG